MNVLDLFSGIGGFSLGLDRAGMKTVSFCEVDLECRNVLRKHWPGIPIIKDIKTAFGDGRRFLYGIREEEFHTRFISENIDLICGGYPCTGHSVAGKKEGLQNEASGLWREYRRLIGELRPKYIIIENSHNLRSTGLVDVLKDIGSFGYNAEWSIINAYSVGSPHQRERIYIVAWRENLPYCDPFRSWNSDFAEEEIKQNGRPKGRIERGHLFREVSSFEPKFLRTTHGLPEGLHACEERIKQLGNSIVPTIAELIGRAIMESRE